MCIRIIKTSCFLYLIISTTFNQVVSSRNLDEQNSGFKDTSRPEIVDRIVTKFKNFSNTLWGYVKSIFYGARTTVKKIGNGFYFIKNILFQRTQKVPDIEIENLKESHDGDISQWNQKKKEN